MTPDMLTSTEMDYLELASNPKTNYDRLREMSLNDLAVWLAINVNDRIPIASWRFWLSSPEDK